MSSGLPSRIAPYILKIVKWFQKPRIKYRRFRRQKSRQPLSRRTSKTGISQDNVHSRQQPYAQTFFSSSAPGSEGSDHPEPTTLPLINPEQLRENLPQTECSEPNAPLDGAEPSEPTTQLSALRLEEETTNRLSQTPLSPRNLPVPAFPPDANSSESIYFDAIHQSFLGCIEKPDGNPTFGGGYSNVWRCGVRFCVVAAALPSEVAVKILRSTGLSGVADEEVNERLQQRFWQELITWVPYQAIRTLHPFLGGPWNRSFRSYPLGINGEVYTAT